MTKTSTASTAVTVDEKLIKRLARLARLALDDAEVRMLVPELSGIVRHVDALRAIDTTGVPPMTHGAPLGSAAVVAAPANGADVDVLGRVAVAQSAGFDSVDGTVRVPRVVE